jgi:hypothetical protein
MPRKLKPKLKVCFQRAETMQALQVQDEIHLDVFLSRMHYAIVQRYEAIYRVEVLQCVVGDSYIEVRGTTNDYEEGEKVRAAIAQLSALVVDDPAQGRH